ncbi:F-box/LRR-repeat protein 5-like [Acanthaster planci]|uniref:F-box/LRR-repeat protein 5-like n=1 Tax=Acanthaster planci TaxID=133434 RepID=A0A8B7XJK3_ACAPL|nr:F-box/LRR-repeat protein 5-like [Acanthaster planci]
MAPAPKEVDVFSGPHSRMKELVRIYSDKLTATDFSNYAELRGLLWSLRATFREFKTHEHIENECIMQKLRHRLDYLKIENQAVYKIHSDNRLSEMQGLLEEGCKKTEHCHSPSEMITIGSKIRDALEVFTKDFLPHMQEEEECFQPLLMKYFTYEELKRIRYDVIERHTLHTKYRSENDKELAPEESYEKVDDVKDDISNTSQDKTAGLPSEVLVHIFSYLSPKDLCRCAQVNSQWNQLAMDGMLWKSLHPVRWAQGDWRFVIDDFHQDIEDLGSDDGEGNYITVDEDADFNESESSADSDEKDSHEVSQSALRIRREAKMLDGIAKHLIPVVGHGVETLMLSQSKGLNNAMVYRLLSNAPNLKQLDLSLTKISDIAFKRFGKNGSGRRLKHLNLSGCTSITDATLKRLSLAISPPLGKEEPNGDTSSHQLSCSLGACGKYCSEVISIDELSTDKNGRPKSQCAEKTVSSDSYEVHLNHSSQGTRLGARLGSTGQHSKCKEMSEAFLGKLNRENNICQSFQADDSPYRTKDCCGNSKGSAVTHRTCCTNISTMDRSDGFTDRQLANHTSQLEFLSLAGCYRITDDGLRYLAGNGGQPRLRYLDLSGCLSVTSTGLNQLAAACTSLDHEEFFYCDNILEGPYADTASGCQNLQCRHLVCCRSGE